MQTRRARVQDANLSRLSDPKFLQAFGRTNPLEARQLAVALGNRDLYNEVMNVVPPRGDYRYGERLDDLLEYIPEFRNLSEDVLLNTVLRTYTTTNPVTGIKEETINPNFTSHNSAALRFCAKKGFERCVKRLLDYDVDVHANEEEALLFASKYNINIVKMLLKKGAILNADHLYMAARWAQYDILRYYISLNKSLLYEQYGNIYVALAANLDIRTETIDEDGIATMRFIYEIAKRDNKLDELQNAIGNALSALATYINPTPSLFALMTDIFNDGFPIHWQDDQILFRAVNQENIQMIEYLLSKGATILARHIKTAYEDKFDSDDTHDGRILFFLLSRIPPAQLANVPN